MLRPECEKGRAAWPVFLRSSVLLIDILDRELRAAAGLQLTWFDVLVQLSRTEEGRMPMKQLAQNVLLSKSGVTRLVDRMEAAGFIKRDSCENDGRVVYAAMTRQGRAVFNKSAPVAFKSVENHFARHITQTEAEQLVKTLKRVLQAAGDEAWLAGRLKPAQTSLSKPAGASSSTARVRSH